jgi:hypothetical protein
MMEAWKEKLREAINEELLPIRDTLVAQGAKLESILLRLKALEQRSGGLEVVHNADTPVEVFMTRHGAACRSCGSMFVRTEERTDGAHLICNDCGCQR